MKTIHTLIMSFCLGSGALAQGSEPISQSVEPRVATTSPKEGLPVLTGIIAFGSERWVTLVHTQPAGVRCLYTLREGQELGSLSVVRIDLARGVVEVTVDGQRQLIGFSPPAPSSSSSAALTEEARRLRFVREHARFHEEQFRRQDQ